MPGGRKINGNVDGLAKRERSTPASGIERQGKTTTI